MKNLYALLLSSFLLSFTTVDDSWKTVQVLEKLTISMPANVQDEKPAETLISQFKRAVQTDSTEISLALVNLVQLGLTEDMLNMVKETAMFKEAMQTGLLKDGATIVKESSGKHQDKYQYYQYELSKEEGGKKQTLVTRIVYYKTYAITLAYKTRPGKLNQEDMDRFFNSLTIGA